MELWEYLKKSTKPIVLYGMGNGADRILDILEKHQIKVSGVFASDDFVRHQNFRGFTVCSYSELKGKFGEMIVLLAFGTHRPEVLENVYRIMEEQEVFAPDVPVAGETIFNADFLASHRKGLEKVYHMLADDQSRSVFEKVVRSKLTGEITPLLECTCSVEDAWGLFELGNDESYLDLGAYIGDTVERFLQFTDGKYRRIWAVEPDFKNYKRLLKNTETLQDITCFNCCVDDRCGERRYEMDGGRKSKALSEGGITIEARTVDDLLGGQAVSLIKIDVEGMEAAVLRGASESIRRYKPSMQISAYHRPEDLYELPLLIEKICPGAKIYMRRFLCLPAWDTDFYIKF